MSEVAGSDKLPAAERKRLKKEEEAKRKAEEKKKAEQAAKAEAEGKKPAAEASLEDLDPTQYRENRIAKLKTMKEPYPHKWPVNISIPAVVEKYKDLAEGQHEEGVDICIAGRVKSQR